MLVRPHPQHAGQWRGVDLAALGAVVGVAARPAPTRSDAQARRDYFDSIHHCAAVVGINTSALIESAIVGRPVLTVLAPEFRDTQEGTLHFAHLAEGGLLTTSASLEDHAERLAAALEGPAEPDPAAREFVRSFVRPHGLDTPATPLVVDAVERLAGTAVQAPQVPPGARAMRAVLAPLAALAWLDAAARRVGRPLAERVLAARRARAR